MLCMTGMKAGRQNSCAQCPQTGARESSRNFLKVNTLLLPIDVHQPSPFPSIVFLL